MKHMLHRTPDNFALPFALLPSHRLTLPIPLRLLMPHYFFVSRQNTLRARWTIKQKAMQWSRLCINTRACLLTSEAIAPSTIFLVTSGESVTTDFPLPDVIALSFWVLTIYMQERYWCVVFLAQRVPDISGVMEQHDSCANALVEDICVWPRYLIFLN